MLRSLVPAALFAACLSLSAQWTIEDAHVQSDLRGVANVDGKVAWASGSGGTVLHTIDAGSTWQLCAMPPAAEKLDFRGIQAFDKDTAIVMSSGPGELSRLYKTTDGCHTWKLLATNPEKQGFFDAIVSEGPEQAMILGDSVGQKAQLWRWQEAGAPELELSPDRPAATIADEGSFAASNSILYYSDGTRTSQLDPVWSYRARWATGTARNSFLNLIRDEATPTCEPCREEHLKVETPLAQGVASAGVFSFFFRNQQIGVAVGGDYLKPEATVKTAAFSTDYGLTWKLALTPPHGYRSAVAYDSAAKTWVTVGPTGTDVSRDDGRHWQPLKPDKGEVSDADLHWNALALPFVVGAHGRIGKLRPHALEDTLPDAGKR